MSELHRIDDLISLFNALFLDELNTELVSGDGEPIYLPAHESREHHQIVFAHGFFASALHEIAHWCVAGPERRLLEDFGYWYKPDGRTATEQALFEQVEIKPQAYEWILSRSAGKRFHFSADNLSEGLGASDQFKESVVKQIQLTLTQGMNPRLKALSDALRDFYQQPALSETDFRLEQDWAAAS